MFMFRKGYKRTKEEKQKISKSHIGLTHSEETKQKMRGPRSSMIGNTNAFGKGHTLSAETRMKMSKAHIGKNIGKGRQIGKKNPMYGKHHSIETLRKISESQRGEKGNNWQGGKSFEPYSPKWTTVLRVFIRERDEYICQISGQYGNCVHHIDYDKKNCDPKNLITLSNSWNIKVNFNRDYWIKYFNQITN